MQTQNIDSAPEHGNQKQNESDLNISWDHCAPPLPVLRATIASARALAICSSGILRPRLSAGTSIAIAAAAIECNGCKKAGRTCALSCRLLTASAAADASALLSF